MLALPRTSGLAFSTWLNRSYAYKPGLLPEDPI